jgi:Jacalin-like lectin domain
MKLRKTLFIAGLVAVAALCGGGKAAAQQATVTDVVGGPGGRVFMDQAPEQGARVIEVQVHSGEYVDSVELLYMLDDGRTVMGPLHGGPGGQLSAFHLDADEYLVGASGRVGEYIDSIEFQTNKRTSPTYGGSGGNRNFNVSVPPNNQVTGFAGRGGQYLDAIGLTFTPMRRRIFSGFGRTPQPGQTDLAGGSGGTEFVDADVPVGGRIVEVRVHGGDYIDSIQMIYAMPDGRLLEAAVHGGEGGQGLSFRLDPGEYIIGISGRCGQYVDSLQIRTNKRTSQSFGGRGGDREFRIDVPDGNQATGFIGRQGEYLDAIGIAYGKTWVPQGRDRDRDRDRDRRHDR